MAKLHEHPERWQCQACGWIWQTSGNPERAGEAAMRPDSCPDCGGPIVKLEERIRKRA
jgi:NAD-dependent SIR2 family protein deacetylase